MQRCNIGAKTRRSKAHGVVRSNGLTNGSLLVAIILILAILVIVVAIIVNDSNSNNCLGQSLAKRAVITLRAVTPALPAASGKERPQNGSRKLTETLCPLIRGPLVISLCVHLALFSKIII